MIDAIAELLDRWDRLVTPLAKATTEARDAAEKSGLWARADELAFDLYEVMALMGEEAIDLLRQTTEEQHVE